MNQTAKNTMLKNVNESLKSELQSLRRIDKSRDQWKRKAKLRLDAMRQLQILLAKAQKVADTAQDKIDQARNEKHQMRLELYQTHNKNRRLLNEIDKLKNKPGTSLPLPQPPPLPDPVKLDPKLPKLMNIQGRDHFGDTVHYVVVARHEGEAGMLVGMQGDMLEDMSVTVLDPDATYVVEGMESTGHGLSLKLGCGLVDGPRPYCLKAKTSS